MHLVMFLLNLAACGVIWVSTMHFYLRRGRPSCASQHFNQVALILIAVGAFAASISAMQGGSVTWSGLALRLGVAMLAGKQWLVAWREYQRGRRV